MTTRIAGLAQSPATDARNFQKNINRHSRDTVPCVAANPNQPHFMKSDSRVLRVFDGAIDRILCVIGAVLLSQGPEFMQQYLQRLGGHLSESQRQLVSFHEAATHAGVPYEKFVDQTKANPDAGVSQLGKVMERTTERTASLQTAHDALLGATPWTRPFVFLRHLDYDIGRATWSVYKPAVPVTIEGILYTLSGMLFFLLIYHLGVKNIFALFRRKPAVKPAS